MSDNATLSTERYGGMWQANTTLGDDNGTSHISIVDRNRMAVSMTMSINTAFGSKVYSKSTGELPIKPVEEGNLLTRAYREAKRMHISDLPHTLDS